MKQRTEQDVFLTLAALCAQGEHCQRASGEADYAGRVVVRPEATREALINPGMGWVYYHFDNSNWNYGAADLIKIRS